MAYKPKTCPRPVITEEPIGTPKEFPKVCRGCSGNCSGSPGRVAFCTKNNKRKITAGVR